MIIMADDCIFCKIIKGDIPSMKVFESDKVYAFLDINPLSDGHFLIIPKTHAERTHQVPDDELAEILLCAKQLVSKAGYQDYNILQNNGTIAHQIVMHVHFHVIPKPDRATGLIMEWDTLKRSTEQLKESQDMYN